MTRDAVTVLADERAAIAALVRQLLGVRGTASEGPLFDEVAVALGDYLRAIDDTVLPALGSAGVSRLDDGTLRGHAEVKHCLAELLTLPRGSDAFNVALGVLAERLDDQGDQESLHLLPTLQQCTDVAERALMANELQSQLFTPAPDDPVRLAMALDHAINRAHILLDEARIVLGSLPSHRPAR